MPGYHTEWFKSKHNPKNQELANEDNEKQTNQHQSGSIVESEIETSTFDDSFAPTITDDNITETVENSALIIGSRKTVSLEKEVNTTAALTNHVATTKTEITTKKAVKNKLTELKSTSASADDSGSGALRAIGWVVVILGILILLLVSLLIGALLMLLGLVFVIAGKKDSGASSQSNTKSDNSQYVDIVYLKNGSIIRGIIIEQIPNESIKIQTQDGSIFVYKMEEVEKMTKELSK